MKAAGDEHDGRSALPPATTPDATGPTVPTRDELRARWTCDCELLGLVTPRVPGSHKVWGFMCSQRRATREAEWKAGQVFEVLVRAMLAEPLISQGAPPGLHRMWMMLGKPPVTWALCSMARRRNNPAYSVGAEDTIKDRSIPKTILVPAPWESWAIRSDVVRGSWAGWQGEAAKPDVFRVRGVRGNLNYTEALKIIKNM